MFIIYLYHFVIITVTYQLSFLCRTKDAQTIYRDATQLHMLDKGWAWIVTEQAFQASNLPSGMFTFN